jgi:hypothetical protein
VAVAVVAVDVVDAIDPGRPIELPLLVAAAPPGSAIPARSTSETSSAGTRGDRTLIAPNISGRGP